MTSLFSELHMMCNDGDDALHDNAHKLERCMATRTVGEKREERRGKGEKKRERGK